MTEFLSENYLLLKALHLIAVISWMAGLFYLPRLFVYHTRVAQGSEADQLFQVMEHKLLKIIMNPAMIASWVIGILLIKANTAIVADGWIHAKLTLVLILSGFQGYLGWTRKQFVKGTNKRSEKFFRIINEVPTLIMITVVVLAVFKMF